jgi:D-psicose/D-tagatose/L-ribulose 3-epimerase
MKLGMNLLLWTTHVTEEHFPTIGKIKAAGYDGVELPIFDGDVSHYAKIGAELKRSALKSTAVTIMTPDANPISPDASVRQQAIERFKKIIGNAAAAGSELLCGPFHSALGHFSGQPPTADERKRAVEVLRQAAEMARAAGIRLAVEYLNRFECYFLTTAAEAAALVTAVQHPAFGMMYDTFHANIEEKDPPSAFRAVAKQVIHIHISENDRGTPGRGHVQWKETFGEIKRAGYDGWLTIEAFGRALPDLAAATRVWRDFFASDAEVYTEGIRFVRKMLV